jgi:hypothetical protein
MPHGAIDRSSSRDRVSPFESSASPHSDVNLLTPPFNSPTIANSVSPLSKVLERKTVLDRAHLFLEGRLDTLAKSMNDTEKRLDAPCMFIL